MWAWQDAFMQERTRIISMFQWKQNDEWWMVNDDDDDDDDINNTCKY